VNFILAHHHRLGAEAFDDGAAQRADLRAGQKIGTSFLAPASSKASRTCWMNCCSLDGAMASWRSSPCRRWLRRRPVPSGRQRDQRQISARRQIGVAELAGQAARTCSVI
jgi:hypothetical protein